MAKGRGQKVNRADLAAIFGVSLPTVDAWVKAGCPYDQRAAGKGRPWVFDTADVGRWREQRAADEAGGDEVQDDAALKRRKLIAEVRSAELELLQKMGELAPVADFERTWSRVLAELQTNLRGAFVVRLESQLLGETDGRKFKRIALAEVETTLESLAGMDVDAEADADADADAEDADSA